MTAPMPPAGTLARLRAQRDHWRRVAFEVETDLQADIAEWFGLQPAEARILAALYVAGGRERSRDALAVASRSSRKALSVRVYHIRRAMEPEAIDGAAGRGYWLTEVGMAECATAIAEIAKVREAA
jgi:hypothetical protein